MDSPIEGLILVVFVLTRGLTWPRLDNNDLELLKLEPRLPALGEPAGTTTPDFIY